MTELFVRKKYSSSENSDEWDDTELIKAYDIAISNSKQKIHERLKRPKNKPESSGVNDKNNLKTITVGGPCRAIYDVDNIEYEANIISVDNEFEVTVEYIGYGNTQKVLITDLKPSLGLQARVKQEKEARLDDEIIPNDVDMETDSPLKRSREHKNLSSKVPRLSQPPFTEINMFGEMSFPPPPPLPPSFCKNMQSGEHEAMNAMLMSWYMSGYYTGYYQGLKKSKN